MRAWVIDEHGGPEVFKQVQLSTPEPGPGEVRIRVAATSVNPVDYKIRSGAAQALCPPKPAILHGDVSGTIDAVGDGVQAYAVGDRVYGCIGGYGSVQGTLADYAIADSDLIAHAPESLALTDAAALPLVTLTAWEGWDKIGDITGQHVLVHGGTGGVGHLALQLAKARGANVSATVGSEDKACVAQQLGADLTIQYKHEEQAQYLQRITEGKGFDAVFDTVGGPNIATSVQAIKPNGHVACIQGRTDIDGGLLHMQGASLHLVFILIPILKGIDRARHGRILNEAAQLVEAGKLQPMIDDKRFTFDQIADAHAYAETGKQIGKVLVVNRQA